MTKQKVGRPKLPEAEKKTYKRIAVYPHSYKLFKQKAFQRKQKLIDLFEEIIDKL